MAKYASVLSKLLFATLLDLVSCPTRWSLWYWYLDIYVDHPYISKSKWQRNIVQQCATTLSTSSSTTMIFYQNYARIPCSVKNGNRDPIKRTGLIWSLDHQSSFWSQAETRNEVLCSCRLQFDIRKLKDLWHRKAETRRCIWCSKFRVGFGWTNKVKSTSLVCQILLAEPLHP